MYQVDKIIELRNGIEQEVAKLEQEIASLKKRLVENEAILPGLIEAQNLLSANLPNPNENEPKIIKYRAANNFRKS